MFKDGKDEDGVKGRLLSVKDFVRRKVKDLDDIFEEFLVWKFWFPRAVNVKIDYWVDRSAEFWERREREVVSIGSKGMPFHQVEWLFRAPISVTSKAAPQLFHAATFCERAEGRLNFLPTKLCFSQSVYVFFTMLPHNCCILTKLLPGWDSVPFSDTGLSARKFLNESPVNRLCVHSVVAHSEI